MDKLEKVELIREKTGVSYDDANAALEANKNDVLEPIIWLERLGKVQEQTATFTTAYTGTAPISPEMAQAQTSYEQASEKGKFGKWVERVGAEFRRILKASLDTSFVITRHNERVFSMPVLVVILGIFLWWATFPLLVVGLFLDCHYSFQGLNPITVDVNEVMDNAANIVSEIKSDVDKGDDKANE